jgi:CheY-like chemotaxis protein
MNENGDELNEDNSYYDVIILDLHMPIMNGYEAC